ncbi:MAG: hypothetical protein DRH50_03100, partial [Deltaproteobacteria bacterium]
RDSRRIERCLDGMLDSCFDNGMLVLFIKLCRYYFAIDPDATASYIQAYRDMWDEQAIEKPAKARLMGVTVKNSTNGEKLTQPRESCKGSKRTSLSSPGQWVHKWDCLCGRWQGH